ncbi:caspase family protein [Streptomyces sp. NPDC059917]|uniref:caspase, EACC1-associated type n=1 Tax=Streptomyces sp. NPDC059917 TaxID=3347002 RepID=UPI0036468B6E
MELADPQRSYAVLVGTSAYVSAQLEDIPPVANNLERLGDLLEDPSVWGLPPGHCVRLPQPASATEVLDAVREAARKATDMLFVYYSGHGLTDPGSGELLLTLPTSDRDRPYSSLGYEALRREVLDAGHKIHKVVVLDCCFSGLAMVGGMGGSATSSVTLAERSRIAGSYLLTASAPTREALWLRDEPYTAFTGELVRLLEDGLPGGGQVIEVGRIYEHMFAELTSKGRPLPQQRVSNAVRIAFARNRYGTLVQPVAEPHPDPVHPVPEALRPVLRAQPRVIAEHAARLRATDPDGAGQLLSLAAVLRPAQEVAALVWVLRAAGRDEEAVGVLAAAAAEREPYELAACVAALDSADNGDDPQRLARLAAERSAQDVAGTVKALRAAGQSRAVEVLSMAAIGRSRTTEAILELAGAFWSAELDDEAERVLRVSATSSSEEETTRLAGALLAIGREDEAVDLYLRAASAVVRRTDELVRALRTMDARQRPDDARRLLRRAVEEAPAVEAITRLCDALWEVGLREWALEALRQAAAVLSVESAVALADVLRGDGHDEAMLHLVREVAGAHPADRTVTLVEALRSMGRPLDALRLLTDAADRPGEEIAQLLIALEDSGNRKDWARVLGALPEAPFFHPDDPLGFTFGARPIALVRALHAAGRDHGEVSGALASLPENAFAVALDQLRDAGADDVVHHVLFQLARSDPQAAQRHLRYLEGSSKLDAAVLRGLLRAPDSPVRDEVAELSSDAVLDLVRSAALRAVAVRSLTAAGLGHQVGSALEQFTRRLPPAEVVALLKALYDEGLTEEAHTVVRGAGVWMFPELYRDFVLALHRAGLREYAVYALEGKAAKLGPSLSRQLAATLGVPAPAPAPATPPERPKGRNWFGRG